MTYPYTTDITVTIHGPADQTLVVAMDVECTIDVEVDLSSGEPSATTTEVYVDGRPLSAGDDLAKSIRLQVMEKADADMAAGNGPWDDVREAEGLVWTGPAGSPDAGWSYA